ncbi:MAG: serine/threonine-protein kinase [Calothrix sp. MO_167.B12]|nr:serine/threonine-protein kinase [Calothrix sp. MO_167.B12]
MQPPLTTGTILQNRYRIINTLAQGGFGRTYLAEDQRRFHESCALKELIPTATGGDSWQKAQDLFLREAEILYQIKHSQVPQFRERFEEDQRLFLVQDYIQGKTYRTLLDERQAVGGAFTQTEILHLIQSLLPVLGYIHSQGIIHRDISPENIILRDRDRLPVLIDFGVVKELASRLQNPNGTVTNTYVGKLGYSPTEQMQTGQVFPNSDLYSLAVTAIVLLTGKEPQELFDNQQLTWNWQRWVTVNPQFAQVLNRMLSSKPSNRYQSAAELAPILQSIEAGTSSNAELSQIQTLAVGRPSGPMQPASSRGNPVIPTPPTSVLDNSLAIGAIGAAVVILAGFGSWALVRSIRSQQIQTPSTTISTAPPQTFPSPVVVPSATPTPQDEELPVEKRIKRLTFNSSNTAKVDDTLKSNEIVRYTFRGQAGQQITVMLVQESGVTFQVLTPSEEPVENTAQNVSFYQGILPSDGEYKIDLTTLPGITESDYSLYVGLTTLEQPIPTETPSPIPTDIPTETPSFIPTDIPTPTETPSPIPTEIPSPSATFTPDDDDDVRIPVITPTPDSGQDNF